MLRSGTGSFFASFRIPLNTPGRSWRCGGGHIGLVHEFLDQPMRGETFWNRHAGTAALGVQPDPPLLQVKFEWPSAAACRRQSPVGHSKGFEYALKKRCGLVRRLAVNRCLGFWVSKLGVRSHDRPHGRVITPFSVHVKDHAHRQARA